MDKITTMRQIVASKQAAKVEGVAVDLFSASLVVQVYDALSNENKIKYAAMSVERMVETAYRLNDR